ncbi:insecticidal delta-endotoxin Cry8Ea1 family protein [Bacillus thuringiensis]|uniref:insecticidal delta-endotoxin Cry8Ea1 family protein n=1 Tax=Bacillus thuringiensis TaxID=1428 RepID=UPI002AB59553|nr:insecticidal delta-endotoxin Cry8Ea1 family protein [Bacillus thuringiensis]MDY7965621.1 insecticidal delta-endotoxin Cry8Ea1 family protein [Bacillus thuringiensis]
MNSYENKNEYEILDASRNNSNSSNRYPRYPLANDSQMPMRNMNYRDWGNMSDPNMQFVSDKSAYSSPQAAVIARNAILTSINSVGTLLLSFGNTIAIQSFTFINRMIDLLWGAISPVDPWRELIILVEELVNRRINESVRSEALASLVGLRDIINIYQERLGAWKRNKSPGNLTALVTQANIVDNFFTVNMARFRRAPYELLLLPVYVQAANLHLMLLRDFDLFGAEWGWSPDLINSNYARLQTAIRGYKDHCVTFYNQGLNQFNRSTAEEWIRFNRFRREMTLTVLDLASLFPNYDSRIYPSQIKMELTREVYSDPIVQDTSNPWWDPTITSFATLENNLIRQPSMASWLHSIGVYTGTLDTTSGSALVWAGHGLTETLSNGATRWHGFGNHHSSLTPIQTLNFANLNVYRVNSLAHADSQQAQRGYGVSSAIFHTSDRNNAPGFLTYQVPNNLPYKRVVSELPGLDEQSPSPSNFTHRLNYISLFRAQRSSRGGDINLLMYGWTHSGMERINRLEPDGITQIDLVKGWGGLAGSVLRGPTGGNLVHSSGGNFVLRIGVQASQLPTSYRIRLRYACTGGSSINASLSHSGNTYSFPLNCTNASGRPSNTLLESDFRYVDVPGVFSPSGNAEIFFSSFHHILLDKIEFIPISLLPEGFRIVTALNSNFVVDLNPNNNVTMWTNNGGDNQRWRFTYDQSRNAYVIRSLRNPSLALTWDFTSPTSLVVAAPISPERQEQYWILESVQNNIYILLNLKNRNMVLDVAGGAVRNGTNLIAFPRHGQNAQRFFIRKP